MTSIPLIVLAVNRAAPLRRLQGHTDEVNAIRFDPTRTLLASSSDDHTVRIWSLTGIMGPNASVEQPEESENVAELDKRGGCVILKGHISEVHTIDWVPGAGLDGRPHTIASWVFTI